MISIWYKHESRKPEVIDRARDEQEAGYLAYNYAMAYGTLPRQHRHGKDKVWAGRRDQGPKTGEL